MMMLGKIKDKIRGLLRAVQRILAVILLFIIYFAGFGLTSFFTLFFRRRDAGSTCRGNDSFWIEAEGYSNEMDDCLKES
jgi:hypothetical protein